MGALLTLIGSWGLKALTGLLGQSVAAFIAPIVTAIAAVIKGFFDIIVDLAQTFEGRILLAAMIAAGGGWYVQHRYTYIKKAELASLNSQIATWKRRPAVLQAEVNKLARENAVLAKRPASCPKVVCKARSRPVPAGQ